MADIFISYASEDRERAGRVASVLESCGWSVWWDRKIVVGQAFDKTIESELEAAKCVIVLWSQEIYRLGVGEKRGGRRNGARRAGAGLDRPREAAA